MVSRLKVLDLTTGTVIAKGSMSFNRSTFVPMEIALSNDRIFGSDKGQLKIWNLQNAELEAVLDVPWMSSLIVSADGKLLVGIAGDSYFPETQIQVFRR